VVDAFLLENVLDAKLGLFGAIWTVYSGSL
jgi:hypothetical protein